VINIPMDLGAQSGCFVGTVCPEGAVSIGYAAFTELATKRAWGVTQAGDVTQSGTRPKPRGAPAKTGCALLAQHNPCKGIIAPLKADCAG
jgi:hypothetical protein